MVSHYIYTEITQLDDEEDVISKLKIYLGLGSSLIILTFIFVGGNLIEYLT